MDKTFTVGRLRVTFGPAAPADQKVVWVKTPMLGGHLLAVATRNVTVALWPKGTKRKFKEAFATAHDEYVAMAN